MSFRIIEDGHISTPRGFKATGVACGLKEVRARDLAVVYSNRPSTAAALFTTSAIVAAPVFFDQAVLAHSREAIRAVVINAGHANAATGQHGLTTAVEVAKLAADELEVPRDSVLLMSTGRIGVPLPLERMRDGVRRAASELDSGGGKRAALAILTTDSKPKERALSVTLRDGQPSGMLAGMAKGSRMVHPRFGTLLAVMTTDLALSPQLLQTSLERAVASSFSRLSLDGDTSPNDTIILLANGAAELPAIIDPGQHEFARWQAALDALCTDLALQVARDAAGGGKFVQVHVRGAASDAEAQRCAQAVARSTAVRSACAKSIADWGALLVAVGGSGVELRLDTLELKLGPVIALRDGLPTTYDQAVARQVLAAPEISLTAELNIGTGNATVWTCTQPAEL